MKSESKLIVKNSYLKILCLKFFLIFLFIILILQIFRLQILEYYKWQGRAEARNLFKLTYKGIRGSIYFSDGAPLAINKLVYKLFVLPQEFNKKNIDKLEFAEFVNNVLKIDKSYVLEKLNSKQNYVFLANKLESADIETFQSKYPAYLGIWSLESQYVRVYPNGSLASKILGFTRIEGDNEIGQYGVEQYFDGILSPSKGYFEGIKDKDSKIILNRDFYNIMSRNGVDLTLTIDKGIQVLAESYAKKYLDLFKAKEAIIVVMEVDTGRILGLANYPTYDPNYYWEGEIVDCSLEYYSVLNKDCNPNKVTNLKNIVDGNDSNKNNKDIKTNLRLVLPDDYNSSENNNVINKDNQESSFLTHEEIEKLNKYDPLVREIFRKEKLPLNEVFRNTANSVLYEPGSVVKLITLAIAYEHNAIPKDPNYDLGSHKGCEQILDAVLCTYKKAPVENLTVENMVATSDNIGALRIALKIPKEKYVSTYRDFGLGRISEIELSDEALFKTKDFNDWSLVDIATSSYGQGVAFTAIQLTAAWNTLASGGVYYSPTILKSINDNGNKKNFSIKSQKRVISKEAAEYALKISELATSKAKRKDVIELYKKYRFFGKTGTANVINENQIGYKENIVNTSYIGSIPADNPKVTVLVWFREPRIGESNLRPEASNTALPVWVDFTDRLMLLLNIPVKN